MRKKLERERDQREERVKKGKLYPAEALLAGYLFHVVETTLLRQLHKGSELDELRELQEQLPKLGREDAAEINKKMFDIVTNLTHVVMMQLSFLGTPFWDEYAGVCGTCRYEESWRRVGGLPITGACSHPSKLNPDTVDDRWPCRGWRSTHSVRVRDHRLYEHVMKYQLGRDYRLSAIGKWVESLRAKGYFCYDGPADPDEFDIEEPEE